MQGPINVACCSIINNRLYSSKCKVKQLIAQQIIGIGYYSLNYLIVEMWNRSNSEVNAQRGSYMNLYYGNYNIIRDHADMPKGTATQVS